MMDSDNSTRIDEEITWTPALTVSCGRPGAPIGDMFGIFFEDLNHAADGGLYAEMVQNRSFEFDPIDHPSYHALMGWEATGSGVRLAIGTEDPWHPKNPRYLVLEANPAVLAEVSQPGLPDMTERLAFTDQANKMDTNPSSLLDSSPRVGILNTGFSPGMAFREGQACRFSVLARHFVPMPVALTVTLETGSGQSCAEAVLPIAPGGWQRLSTILTPDATDFHGRLRLTVDCPATLHLDMVSLFPSNTFMDRENGLRADIAQLLADLKPKFMRFPGGCLVHDGQLDADARDSMYRWKNTLGDVAERPARRNNWGYNQTLGLGYFEYFQFCEDIGAKPLPVLPAGYDPHHKRATPMNEMQPWIDDAFDLIDFANGSLDTVWGEKRAELGHPEPFGLEYLAIGNEEVGEAFFERYDLFHAALRARHPEIRLINSSGPFPAGSEYDRGWASARKNGSDLVDEHYYTSPEWFLANLHRYDGFPADGPKVFLGEYATWGNTVYNALVEAAFMTQLEKDAHSVGLACYAPMLCNVDYVNWKPDLIWFDNHRAFGTVNYHVQKLFMHHQGTHVLPVALDGFGEAHAPSVANSIRRAQAESGDIPAINGTVSLGGNQVEAVFSGISIHNPDTGETLSVPDFLVAPETGLKLLGRTNNWNRCVIRLTARKTAGRCGFILHFGGTDAENHLIWEIGGWQNQDSIVGAFVNRRNTCLTQSLLEIETDRIYDLRLEIEGRHLRTFVDGVLLNETEDRLPVVEPLYATASLDAPTGDVIVKVVNLQDVSAISAVRLSDWEDQPGICQIFSLSGHPLDAENSLDMPERVIPAVSAAYPAELSSGYAFPAHSLTVLRFTCTAERSVKEETTQV